MDSLVPPKCALHGWLATPRCEPASHNDIDGTTHPYEQHRDAGKLPCASLQDAKWPAVLVVMANIDRYADALCAQRSNCRIHRFESGHHKRFEIRTLAARAKPHAGS
jgi:hypothetical protein